MFKKIFIVIVGIVAIAVVALILEPVINVLKPDPKAVFLDNVRDNVSMATRWSDDELVRVAEAACEALKSGSTIREITYVIATSSEVDDSEVTPIASVVGYGLNAYCPELGDTKLKEYSGQGS